MQQLLNLDDTIVAIATPMGSGGIGVVRLSGPQALSIVDQLFQVKNRKRMPEWKNFTVQYGWIVKKMKSEKLKVKNEDANDTEEIIDEVLVSVMRAPHSYTKEDVVEISCHGGIVPVKAILCLAIDLGARLAEPGEFTKRAFLNGRIDLTQAEAVLDVIQSKTDAFLRVSTNQLKGELSTELNSIREILSELYIEMEAIVNFPEDDVDADGRAKLIERLAAAMIRVERLLESSEQGRILKEGIKVVLCGKPNVGKSSLLNVLLKQPRAIVSDIAGTTRDTIEETAQIRGIPFQLVDTAGILEPRDLIEEEAVKRSHLYIDGADLVLLIFDRSEGLSPEDELLIRHVKGKNVLAVLNKCDLNIQQKKEDLEQRFGQGCVVEVSALKKTAIEDLEEAILKNVWQQGQVNTPGLLVSNLRHIQSLKKAENVLRNAKQILQDGLSLEFVSEEIKEAIHHLDRITGRDIDTDLLDQIFSQFCIGK